MSDAPYFTQAAHRDPDHRPPTGLSLLADHWGLVLAYGLISLGLGLTLAVWPDETLTVVAVLIGVQFLVSGVFRVVTAIAASALDTSVRVLLGVTGALAFIVGLLCLRDPLQTLVVIGLILGVWWVASGVIDVVGALVGGSARQRTWDIVSGIVSIVAGGFLLIDTAVTLGVLVLVVCLWLIVTGVFGIISALRLRSHRSPTSARTSTPPAAPAL